MAGISDFLEKIKKAVYGEEVRGSIVGAIEQCYTDTSTSIENCKQYVEECRTDTTNSIENCKKYVDTNVEECRSDTNKNIEECRSYTTNSIENCKQYVDTNIEECRTDTSNSIENCKKYVDEKTAIYEEDIKRNVEDYIAEHPELTTTVQDGTITEKKLSSELAGRIKTLEENDETLMGKTLTSTLSIGETTVTLTDDSITESSVITVYTDKGLDYNSLNVTSGSVVIEFDEQEDNVNVRVEVR